MPSAFNPSKVFGGLMLIGLLVVGSLMFGHIIRRVLAEDPPGAGVEAPQFSLPQLGAEGPVSLSSLRPRVVLLEFWTSTCVGCIGATPKLNRLHERYREQGFMVVSINMDGDGGHQARDVVRGRGIKYPVLIDPGHVAQRYGVYATPTAILLDAQGRIFSVHKGNVTETRLNKEVKHLIQERDGTVNSRAQPLSPSAQMPVLVHQSHE